MKKLIAFILLSSCTPHRIVLSPYGEVVNRDNNTIDVAFRDVNSECGGRYIQFLDMDGSIQVGDSVRVGGW
jgi:hypothetical protein